MAKMGNILVLTRNVLHKALIDYALISAGFAVVTVEEMLEALNRILLLRSSSQPSDLVIVDSSLPRFSAEDFVRNLRKAGADIPVVVLVVEDPDSQRNLMAPLGGVSVVSRTLIARDLLPTVNRALRGNEGPKAGT
jgi:DNA-binding response OmpR family regulator